MKRLAPEALYSPGQYNIHRLRENIRRDSMGLPPLDHDVTDYSQQWRIRTKAATEKPPQKSADLRLAYELRGTLYTEDRPIRLEETIRAKDDFEAISIARRKAREYRDVEGYAVALFTFNSAGKQIGNTRVKAKKK